MTDKIGNEYKFSPEYIEAAVDENKKCFLRSLIPFLSVHNGLRRGKLHVFMGDTHSGKSTFMRTLLIDVLQNNSDKNIFLFLSEESTNDFLIELHGTLEILGDKTKCRKILKKVKVLSAVDEHNITKNKLFMYLKQVKPDLFIFDNLTTCSFYDKYEKQEAFIKESKSFVKELDIPFVYYIHTKKKDMGKSNYLGTDDVRGSQTIGNIAEFFYSLQIIANEEYDQLLRKEQTVKHSICRMVKHRGYEVRSDTFYLGYSKDKKIYDKITQISFKDLRTIWKERNVL